MRTLHWILGPAARLAWGGCLVLISGCASLGEGAAFDPGLLRQEEGWIAVRNVPLVLQKEATDCGAAAIQMVLTYWQVPATQGDLAERCPELPGEGIRAQDLRDLARNQGLGSYLLHGTWEDLLNEVGSRHPVIVGLVKPCGGGARTHYEVVVAVQPTARIVVTQDPSKGWRQYPWEGFRKEWEPAGFLTLVFSGAESRQNRPDPGL